jgi:four helix bundle protein
MGGAMKRDLCERTFEFGVRIVKLCRECEKNSDLGRTLSRQVLRSGTSVGANVEEGQGGQSRADFVSKYSIARKEARETHYWLRLLVATDLIAKAKLSPVIQECDELIAILTAIIKKTKNIEK